MNKENQRIALSKRMLKEALLELMKSKDIRKISITELCQKAEINRATFYRHYTVPQDVLWDIEAELIDQAQNIAPFPTTIKGAKPYLEKLFSFIYDHADIVRLLIHANTEANLVHLLDQCNYAILLTKVKMIDGDQLDEASMKLLSSYLSGGGYFLVRAWLMNEIQKTPEEIAQLIFDLATRDVESYVIG